MREEERVTPLELFFDLVFVLALTQCTALMSENATWEGVGQGLLVLGLMWWAWTGYAWLTSVVEPEEGAVRIVIFAAMAGLLVVALCIPRGVRRGGTPVRVRLRHRALRADRALSWWRAATSRRCAAPSLTGLVGSTTISIALLIGGSFADPGCRRSCGRWRSRFDMAGPMLFGVEGWKLVPGSLRRAPRPDPDHRAGRVDRGDRRGRRVRGRRRCRDRPPCSASWWRPRCGGCTSTWSRWSRSGGCRGRRSEWSRTRSRATRTRSCTCRWWPGSSWWRWA